MFDINDDTVPELFINTDPYAGNIFGIYTLADGKPVSLLQKETAREVICFYSGGAVNRQWAHMGIVVDLFYTLPQGADKLALADGLYTDWNAAAQKEECALLENADIVQYGEHFKGAIRLIPENTAILMPITMEEWEAVMGKYAGPLGPVIPEWYVLADYPGGGC